MSPTDQFNSMSPEDQKELIESLKTHDEEPHMFADIINWVKNNLDTVVRIVIVLVFLWGTYLFGGCATINNDSPVTCDDYVTKRVQDFQKQGTTIMNAGSEVTADGVILWLQFANGKNQEIYFDVLVDTDKLGELMVKEGLTLATTCDRGGHLWYVYTNTIKTLKGREAQGTH